jgi:hypothetical protein
MPDGWGFLQQTRISFIHEPTPTKSLDCIANGRLPLASLKGILC